MSSCGLLTYSHSFWQLPYLLAQQDGSGSCCASPADLESGSSLRSPIAPSRAEPATLLVGWLLDGGCSPPQKWVGSGASEASGRKQVTGTSREVRHTCICAAETEQSRERLLCSLPFVPLTHPPGSQVRPLEV